MTARTAWRHWFWRETSYVYKVGVMAAFGVTVVVCLGDWLRPSPRTRPPEAQVTAAKPDPDAAYTGAIITVPIGMRDDCGKVNFDNRTGRMWDAGSISCEELVAGPAIARGQSTIARMRSIGRAFNGQRD